jgi:hypothetical protein
MAELPELSARDQRKLELLWLNVVTPYGFAGYLSNLNLKPAVTKVAPPPRALWTESDPRVLRRLREIHEAEAAEEASAKAARILQRAVEIATKWYPHVAETYASVLSGRSEEYIELVPNIINKVTDDVSGLWKGGDVRFRRECKRRIELALLPLADKSIIASRERELISLGQGPTPDAAICANEEWPSGRTNAAAARSEHRRFPSKWVSRCPARRPPVSASGDHCLSRELNRNKSRCVSRCLLWRGAKRRAISA